MAKQGIFHHSDGSRDKRYTVEWEYCGCPVARAVARFCGNWLGACRNKKRAWIIAQEHYDNHKIDTVYPPAKQDNVYLTSNINAGHIEQALKAFHKSCDYAPGLLEDQIAEFLVSLNHFCLMNDIDLAKCVREGQKTFNQEMLEEKKRHATSSN